MKRISLLYLLLAMAFFSCDNDEIPPSQAESFTKFYGAGMIDEGIQVITTESGYLIMANLQNPVSERDQDIAIIRTDKYGNITAPMTIIGGYYEDKGNVFKRNAKGYLIAGYTRSGLRDDKDAYLIQIDPDSLQIIWEWVYPNDLVDDEIFDLIVSDTGSIVMAGYTQTNSNGKTNMLLIETDSLGKLLLMKNQGQDNVDEGAYAIAKTPGAYLLAGVEIRQGVSSIYALHWDGGKNPLPFRPKVEKNYEAEARAIIKKGDEYLLACNVWETGTNLPEIQIIKMDEEGRSNVTENIKLGEYKMNTVSDMKIVNNTLYLSGTSSDYTYNRGYMLLIKAGLNGANPVYYYAGDSTSYKGNGFDLTTDGGFIITGAAYTSEQSTIALSKLGN